MSKDLKSIIIIGTGNVSYHLTRTFLKTGIHVAQVVAHTESSAERFALDFNVPVVTVAPSLLADADLYILAVNDDKIKEAANALCINDRLLVHTSGSVKLDSLRGFSSRIGVFYPLQTFSYGKDLEFEDVPICVEANSDEDERALVNLAEKISRQVNVVDSKKREVLHLAAVFASNFSYHMHTIASEILVKFKIDPELLNPLILETARKAVENSPGAAQTGPAARQDLEIIDHHLKQLADHPLYSEIYKLLTKSIISHKKQLPDEL